MSGVPGEIFRRWGHSFEEDQAGVAVYRPAEFDFPRARGRSGIEFKRDGGFVEWTIGPGDARKGIPGRWEPAGPNRVRISLENASRPPQTLEIVASGDDILKIRPGGA